MQKRKLFDPDVESTVLPNQKKKKAVKSERWSNVTVAKGIHAKSSKGRFRKELAAKGVIQSVKIYSKGVLRLKTKFYMHSKLTSL